MQESSDARTWSPPKDTRFGLPDDAMDGGRRPRTTRTIRLFVVIAWIAIAAVIVVGLVEAAWKNSELKHDPNPEDPVGMVLMRMQMRYIVGASEVTPDTGMLFQSAQSMNVGTLGQRQCFVPVAAEIAGREKAHEVLADLQRDIDDMEARDTDPKFELTEEQRNVNAALEALYGDASLDGPTAVAQLTDDQRAVLEQELEWFGELALLPEGIDDAAARQSMLAPAMRMVAVMVAVAVLGIGLGVIGFIGLIVMIVMLAQGKFASSITPGRVAHGIYAETFAIWLVAFMLLQVGLGVLFDQKVLPESMAMPATLAAFFGSLVVLAWPVMRGANFSDVRKDIGWTLGRTPALEPLFGPMFYVIGLPILGLGVACTFLLMVLQGAFTFGAGGAESLFAPTGGPAHPVVLDMAAGDWSARIMLLLLAAVAAPIVEETMFRGVLYRHLRDGFRPMAFVLNVMASTALSSFVFAIIHPQGWVAAPVLMSLATVFCLAREWRGTLIPSMLVHGISNGIVMTMLLVVLSG
ncbi:MAG: CPBP family intramembrane metalloprotease [Phycisphaerales bacterium]|nr:CPBP family intramembrane metalloprotease [Phycisphaerales bacterium]